jgi:hypothetical protein
MLVSSLRIIASGSIVGRSVRQGRAGGVRSAGVTPPVFAEQVYQERADASGPRKASLLDDQRRQRPSLRVIGVCQTIVMRP